MEAPLVAASSGGCLSEVDLHAHGGAVRVAAREEAAFVALDVEPLQRDVVFACTDSASLTLLRR